MTTVSDASAHLSDGELQGLVAKTPQPGLGRAVRHLLSGCPECRRAVAERLYPEFAPEVSPEGPGVSAETLARAAEQAEAERAAAKALRSEIRRCADEAELLALVRTHRTPAMVQSLASASHEALGDSPVRAVELARTAVRLADLLPRRRYGDGLVNDFRAHARVRLANARRRSSDLRGCDLALSEARKILEAGSGDPLEAAGLGLVEGLLRKDQERYEEACQAVERAAFTLAKCGERHRCGVAMIDRAVVLYEGGKADKAIHSLYAASMMIDATADPRMALAIFHNLSLYHADLGFFDEAAHYLAMAGPLYEVVGARSDQIRQSWLLGSLLLKRHRFAEAETRLKEVRDAFLQIDLPMEAAQVSLELALVCAEQGRVRDLRKLASEMQPLFEALGLQRQALQALFFLRGAIEAEAATAFVVRYVLDFLRRLREDESLTFHPPLN